MSIVYGKLLGAARDYHCISSNLILAKCSKCLKRQIFFSPKFLLVQYFVTFIDDYTRCCRVYFITSKSEVFDKFREFQSCVTNECGNSIPMS